MSGVHETWARTNGNRCAFNRCTFKGLRRERAMEERTHHSAEGKPIADGLAESDDVRHNALRFESPEVISCAAEAALHLVGDAHRPLRPHLLVHIPQIPLRQDDLHGTRTDTCFAFTVMCFR